VKSNERLASDPLASQTHELLVSAGYKFIDDAWENSGRRTYLHDEDATREYVNSFARLVEKAGWRKNIRKLRSFRHLRARDEIELEPRGSEVTGHFLHHLRPRRGIRAPLAQTSAE
jgi:hypothetical protein